MALSRDEMTAALQAMRRQAEGLEDATATYNARGTRKDLEQITSTAAECSRQAQILEEWHA